MIARGKIPYSIKLAGVPSLPRHVACYLAACGDRTDLPPEIEREADQVIADAMAELRQRYANAGRLCQAEPTAFGALFSRGMTVEGYDDGA